MDTYLMKKAMIENAVMRGIKDMESDPERSARRLADLGKQFSKNRFEDNIFTVIQELLNNENSAYYDMIHSLLRNGDREAMKQFGVNFGYMSWVHGANKVRKAQKDQGIKIPWTVMFRYDPSSEEGLTAVDISRVVEQGQELGIYAYFIRQKATEAESYELLEVLERFKDCAFIWMKENGRLTAAQIQMLKVCKNVVVSLPTSDPESLLTCSLLRDQKIVFAMHIGYDHVADSGRIPYIMESVLASETALFFLVQMDDSTCSLRQLCYESRLKQNYPCLIMDYYGDAVTISRVLTGHENVLEIGSDGRVLKPACAAGKLFPRDVSLADAFASLLPVR